MVAGPDTAECDPVTVHEIQPGLPRRLLQLSRPALWFATVVPYLAAMHIGKGGWTTLNIFMLVFLSFPWNLYIYGLNDIADYRSDRLNRERGGVKGTYLPKEWHRPVAKAIVLTTAPFFLLAPFLIEDPKQLAAFYFFFAVLPFAYSVRPLRLKARPFLDSLCSLFYMGSFLIGLSFNPSEVDYSLSIAQTLFFIIGTHAIAACADVESDRKAGDVTVAVFLGSRRAAIYASAIFLLGALVGLRNYPHNLLLAFSSLVAVWVALGPSATRAAIGFRALLLGFVLFVTAWFLG